MFFVTLCGALCGLNHIYEGWTGSSQRLWEVVGVEGVCLDKVGGERGKRKG